MAGRGNGGFSQSDIFTASPKGSSGRGNNSRPAVASNNFGNSSAPRGVGRGYSTAGSGWGDSSTVRSATNSTDGVMNNTSGRNQRVFGNQSGAENLAGWDWPIAQKAESGSYEARGNSSSSNKQMSQLSTDFQNTGFGSYRPPEGEPTGFNAPAEKRGGFGFNQAHGFGSASGFGSSQGGFNRGDNATDSEKRPFGSGFNSKSKTAPKHGLGLMQSEELKDMVVIIKDFYVEDPEITAMSDDETAILRMELNNITVKDVTGERLPPKPVKSFTQAFRSYPEILDQINQQNFEAPSPIQSQMWPIVLSGHDSIGIAQTGTGKTLAFLLPIFIHLDNQPGTRQGPGAVILTPTRELARQIHAEVKKYRYKGLRSVCLYGGASRPHQVAACREGMDIIIACPGRLLDLVDDEVVDLSTVTFVVLDEADRMLDMGFEPDIRNILNDIRSDRQTVLTSATWPDSVRKMAEQYTKNPFLIRVGNVDLSAVHTVTQQVFVVDDEQKKELLLDFLVRMKKNEKVIIFVGKKLRVDSLASEVAANGFKCQRIHGDRDQVDRDQAISDLKKGHVRILLGTDVVSRGLDISDITHVFNYDFPQSIEEYVHRIGRTGRAGRSGVSISLMTRGDWHNSTKLLHILAEANQEVPESLLRMSERYEAKKLELGADAVDPRPPRRRRDGDRGERRKREPAGFFDPYTGEPF